MFLLIIFAHEMGHIITIKLLGYKIRSIIIYPIGGIIKTDININIPSNKLFLISISGILMQLFLFMIIPKGINNYNIFNMINRLLIIYNLLPIYPLDGFKISLSIVERFLPYSISIKLFYFVSITSVFLLFVQTKSVINFIYLYYINIFFIMNYKYYIHKFLLERYLYGNSNRKVKYVNNLNNIFKTRYNYIKYDNIYIGEIDALSYFLPKFIDKKVLI